jgi:hypothetical protein
MAINIRIIAVSTRIDVIGSFLRFARMSSRSSSSSSLLGTGAPLPGQYYRLPLRMIAIAPSSTLSTSSHDLTAASNDLSVDVGDIVTVHGVSSTRTHKLICTNAFGEHGFVVARVLQPIHVIVDALSQTSLVSSADGRVVVDGAGRLLKHANHADSVRLVVPLPLAFSAQPLPTDDAILRTEPPAVVIMLTPVFRVSSGHVLWFARPPPHASAPLPERHSLLLECLFNVVLPDASSGTPNATPEPTGRTISQVIGTLRVPGGAACPASFAFRMPQTLFPSIFARPLPTSDKRVCPVLYVTHTSIVASIINDATRQPVVTRQHVANLIVPGPRNQPQQRTSEMVPFARFSLHGKSKFHVCAVVERLVPGHPCPIVLAMRSARGEHTFALSNLSVELIWCHTFTSAATGASKLEHIVASSSLGSPDVTATEGTKEHVLLWNVPFFDLASCSSVTVGDVMLTSNFVLHVTFDVGIVGSRVEAWVPDVVVDANDNAAVQNLPQPPAQLLARLTGRASDAVAAAATEPSAEQLALSRLAEAPPCGRCTYHVFLGAPASAHKKCMFGDDHHDEWSRYSGAGGKAQAAPVVAPPTEAPPSAESSGSLSRQRSRPAFMAAEFEALDKDTLSKQLVQAFELERDARPCDECNFDVKTGRLTVAHERCEFGDRHEDSFHRVLWLKGVAVQAATRSAEAIEPLWKLPEDRSSRIDDLRSLRDLPACQQCRFTPSNGRYGHSCTAIDLHRAALAKFQHLRRAVPSLPLHVHTGRGDFTIEVSPTANVEAICESLSAESNRVVRQLGARGVVVHASRDALSLYGEQLEAHFGDYVPLPQDKSVDCSRCSRRNTAEALFCEFCKRCCPSTCSSRDSWSRATPMRRWTIALCAQVR